ncbi:hypothetical protein KKF19_03570 [Patescibacteria group bacterium]|nr:hypothetical protein [Patescibacteria group bacterium]
MSSQEEFIGYIKYFGPFLEDGSVDIAKAGRSLVALDKVFKKYQKEVLKLDKNDQFVLKISSVNKNCSELIFLLVNAATSLPVNIALIGLGLKAIGVGEFGKKFFGTLGEQFALKIFSKGKNIIEGKRKINKGKIFVILKNHKGEEKTILEKYWENYKKLAPYISGIVQLEKGKEEEMKIGYKQNNVENEVAKIRFSEKKYFDDYDTFSIDERIREPFDEENAEEIKIIGQFVDFYGLAHKYHFAFQARRRQDDIGKRKILCIVDKEKISEILDYLKPENTKNVCISGKATRDWERKVDKIKIDWINEDENFNPNQTRIG